MADLPRGIANKNPGDLRLTNTIWEGQSPTQTDPDFIQFTTDVYGLRALMKLLLNYQKIDKLTTIRGIIGKYAPPSENDTAAYIAAVSAQLGIGPDVAIDLTLGSALMPFAKAIVVHENGPNPAGSDWYPDSTYAQALALATGATPPVVVAAPAPQPLPSLPPTGTIGTTTALPGDPKPWYTSKTLIGIAVMVLPQVVDAVSAHFNLSSADQQTLLTTITDIGSGIGTLLAIYGRVVATAPIKGKTS